jgi:hypothetical protein
MKRLMKYLDELGRLNLPAGKFAIFGSGPMAVRKIRECADLDIIVKQELWDFLVSKYPNNLEGDSACLKLKIGNIEIYRDWFKLSDRFNEMIDNAEIIANFPFVQLKYVVEWKKEMGREKDISDIALIRKYSDTWMPGDQCRNSPDEVQ